MKIIIDILTPKQCMFFPRLAERLEGMGHRVWMTSRRYRELNQLLEMKGIEARVVGEHGGGRLRDKLVASARRIQELIPVFDEVDPDVSVSFSSPEMARASFGLGVPHVCLSDSPHAVAVSRLTIPLSSLLLTPKIIPREAWVGYGIPAENIIQYNALDPWAWLRDFEPDPMILGELGLNEARPVVTVRVTESYAAYLLKKDVKESSMIRFMLNLLGRRGDLQIVALPRYQEQVEELRGAARKSIVVCEKVVDGASLLHFSDVFVGAGGTMSAEAALLGVPTFSSYPGEPYIVEQYLAEKGLIVRETNPGALVKGVLDILDDPGEARASWSGRAQELVSGFEDPVEVIAKRIERVKER